MVLVLLSSASLILTVFLLSHLYSVLCYLSLPLSSSATAYARSSSWHEDVITTFKT